MPFLPPNRQRQSTEGQAIVITQQQQQHPFNGPFPGQPRWAGTRKVKPIWILLKQEIVSGSGISWAICKSAPHSREITTPAPHHSVFYRPDALPAAQPTASKHWRHSNHTATRIRIQTAGLVFGGTGLCSCRVTGVDGSCTKHLTVEFYMVIYAPNSYTYYY